MKMLIVGVLDVPSSTNVQIEKAFEDLGHEVFNFNYRTIAKEVGYTGMEKILVEDVKENKYDLVFLCKTNKMNPNYITDVNGFSKTWFWWMDPIGTCRADSCVEFARRATWCSATSLEVYKSFSVVNKSSYKIYEGFNPEVFHKMNIPKKYDIVFVGSRDDKRGRIITRLKAEGLNVTTFGPGFDNQSVFLDELNKVNNQGKIVLNICRSNIFSNRIFEAVGSGAFVLTEWCTDVEEDFPSLVRFKSDDECAKLAKYYMNHPGERNAVTKRNYEVISDYTWKKQMEKVLKIVEKI